MIARLPGHPTIDDLLSAGSDGLMDAAARYDPATGVPFGSFAMHRIRGAILDHVRDSDSLSRDMRRLSMVIRDAKWRADSKADGPVSHDDLAREMGISAEELDASVRKISGYSVVGFDDVDPRFLDLFSNGDTPSALDVLELRDDERIIRERVERAIRTLSSQGQHVLSLYYREGLTLREIAAIFGVTESRICQIMGVAIRRLRDLVGPELASGLR